MDSCALVDVFRYRDYRKFLADTYDARKKSEYGFSYRAFARRANLRSPNYLKLVTLGERNLTATTALRFAEALSLRGQEARFFCDLVAFNQSTSTTERLQHFERLQGYRKHRKIFQLDAAHTAYYSEWYIPVIRELVVTSGFRADPKWVARTLRPKISTRQAERAFEILERLGLLMRGEGGEWQQNEALVETGDHQPMAHNLAQFHRMMLEKAADSIDGVPRSERQLSALTLAVDEDLAQRFKERLLELRDEFLEQSVAPTLRPDRVVQVNFQLFPVTQCTGQSA